MPDQPEHIQACAEAITQMATQISSLTQVVEQLVTNSRIVSEPQLIEESIEVPHISDTLPIPSAVLQPALTFNSAETQTDMPGEVLAVSSQTESKATDLNIESNISPTSEYNHSGVQTEVYSSSDVEIQTDDNDETVQPLDKEVTHWEKEYNSLHEHFKDLYLRSKQMERSIKASEKQYDFLECKCKTLSVQNENLSQAITQLKAEKVTLSEQLANTIQQLQAAPSQQTYQHSQQNYHDPYQRQYNHRY